MMRRAILLVATMALTLLVASGVALAVNKVGTNGPDTLRGTNGADNLLGKGGNDILLALAGDDNLLGGPGKDIVLGGSLASALGGDKNLAGGRGNDVVGGGNGSDNVVGGSGNDLMADGTVEHDHSQDILSGGAGKDVIVAANSPAFGDIVTCGSGFDRVLADRKDVVAPDCERVVIGLASFEQFFNSIPQSFFEGLHPQFSPN
jgi:Ca2+-binding RTX toxin-like protein